MTEFLDISPEVKEAFATGKAVVALESTVIAHGLPYPENLETALAMEQAVRDRGAAPATIALLDGKIKIGLSPAEKELLAAGKVTVYKTGRRDISYVLWKKIPGATTVSATMWAARQAGIPVFATGGIGGVHYGASHTFDISADLQEFARTPVAVVSAGIKSVLDIGATLEYLETMGVPVAAYGTDEFPAFFSRNSGYKAPFTLHSPGEAAEWIKTHFALNLPSGLLIAQPPPSGVALDGAYIEKIIREALDEAEKNGIRGKEVTPFLLRTIVRKTGGKSLRTNTALLIHNAALAADIAAELAK